MDSNTLDEDVNSAFISIKKDLSELIENKIFLGKYSERRYVESLQAYRDIITVESSEDIIKNLNLVKKAMEGCAQNKWIGITNDPQNSASDNILLWVQLNNIPIGKHWFQLCSFRFEPQEIILDVQYIQSFRSPNKSFNINDADDFPSFNIKEIFTYPNIREAIKFSAIVIMTLFTLFIEILRYIGEYSIRISYVIVSVIHVSTPICLGIFEFLTKCVGGFYWLVYVMFRGTPNTPAVPRALMTNQKKITYGSYSASKYGHNDYSKPKMKYLNNTDYFDKQR